MAYLNGEIKEIKSVPISELIPYVNNARKHSEKQIQQIASSIKEFGFNNPILIDSENGIIAGHGRMEGARLLGLENVPCIEVKHLTEATKKAFIIADNQIALNSTWDDEILKNELEEIGKLDFNLDLTGFSLKEIDKLSGEFTNKYTKKVEIPQYKPLAEKPNVEEMYDAEKTINLLNAINSSPISEEEKKFLQFAAYRHVEFNFEKIADYYANSNETIKKLFESSALVIIDFENAIANNFIDLNDKLKKQYIEDYEN